MTLEELQRIQQAAQYEDRKAAEMEQAQLLLERLRTDPTARKPTLRLVNESEKGERYARAMDGYSHHQVACAAFNAEADKWLDDIMRTAELKLEVGRRDHLLRGGILYQQVKDYLTIPSTVEVKS